MQSAFLIIISLLAAIYSVWTKQMKLALGILILMVSFILAIPDIGKGIWVDIFGALALIVFLAGMLVIVWKKKDNSLINSEELENKDVQKNP